MISRLLIKVIIFTLLILFFSFYDFNNEKDKAAQDKVAHVSTLLLQEQQLKKQLQVEEEQPLSLSLINEHNIPYVDGTLLDLKQVTERIVLAKVLVTDVYELELKQNQTITVMYTGAIDDEQSPLVEQHYRWLIKKDEQQEIHYYIQGGLQGILKLD